MLLSIMTGREWFFIDPHGGKLLDLTALEQIACLFGSDRLVTLARKMGAILTLA